MTNGHAQPAGSEFENRYIKFLYLKLSNKDEPGNGSALDLQLAAAGLLVPHQLTAMLNPALCNVGSVLQALAGTGNKIYKNQQLTVLAEMLCSLLQSDRLANAYEGHNLPPNIEARLNTIICEQAEWIRQAALENLPYMQTDFDGRLMKTCEQSPNIMGKLDRDMFLNF